MRTGAVSRDALLRRVLILLLLCQTGFAACQPLPTPFREERPPALVMVARSDPADRARYVGLFGDDLENAVAVYRDGRRLRATVPHILQRGDEIETSFDVIAVIRYDVGDVYIDAATHVRIGSLDVLFGKVFARVRGFFSIQSQSVVAGVEGTEFAFEVAGDETMQVTVLDGIVLCSSQYLPWKPLRVTRGQVFGATDSARQVRVGPATPAQLAQLRNWVQRADTAVEALAPREPQLQFPPQPQGQPQLQPQFQPQPQPQFPFIPLPSFPIVPAAPIGYCCDGGNVFRTTPDRCRGSLYDSQAEAYERCRSVRMGYCCANGQVFPSAVQECRGTFSFDPARARASCTATPQQEPPASLQGYCCSTGEVTTTTRDRCRGSFYPDQASARRSCASPPPSTGYCCADGQVISATRNQCRGSFSTDEASARKSCVPPPPLGYCCAGGKVSQTTRDRCSGIFASAQAEAQRACRGPTEIEKGTVIVPPYKDVPRAVVAGWCCKLGTVTRVTASSCASPGQWFADEATARTACAPPVVR